MSKAKKQGVDSFRKQMAQSMADLGSIMDNGESFSGDGRFTVRTVRVIEPSTYRPGAVRAARRRLGVSQAVFAQLLGVSQVLVRSWERGARAPAAVACRLLDVIREHPETVTALIETAKPAPILTRGAPKRRRASAA
jgi:DNA-binding transcriptional regulator YiaG